MRIALTLLATLLLAAPAQAASLPATFAPGVQTAGADGVDIATLGQRFVVANSAGTVTVFPGGATSAVDPADPTDAPRSVATGDLNADGRPDVVTANTKG